MQPLSALPPFPHGMIKPSISNGFVGQIVSVQFDENLVLDFGKWGGGINARFFKTEEVLETRKAKGKWKSKPNWYKLRMKPISITAQGREELESEIKNLNSVEVN